MNSKYAAQERYHAKTRYRVAINLNKKTDPDIIELLEKLDNVQGYIKALIRADLMSSEGENHEDEDLYRRM